MRTSSDDTSPEAERVMISLLRQASPTRKFQMIDENRRLMIAAALSGLRSRHPADSEAKLRRRLADLLLGEELARAAYGPLES
ncbi:MAG: hypothetical protein H6834_11085 [Planctomycetes bacterium]|nr:hypothetical protein [Planctomycetota bacterium]